MVKIVRFKRRRLLDQIILEDDIINNFIDKYLPEFNKQLSKAEFEYYYNYQIAISLELGHFSKFLYLT